jgi:hypothetical protein
MTLRKVVMRLVQSSLAADGSTCCKVSHVLVSKSAKKGRGLI